MADDRLDIVIFGISGFSGKYAIAEAARLAKEKSFTWGIADRCKETLESALKEFAPESENVRIITADVKNDESLRKMTEQARVLVNCCGPYRFYGESVIKACIASGTHQVDASGEPRYMETMHLNYQKAARDAGVYIVNGCGIEALPHDMAIMYTRDRFDGEVNSIESYLNIWTAPNVDGVLLHYDKWVTMVYNKAHLKELRAMQAQLYPKKMPQFEPKLEFRGVIHRNVVTDGWSRPYLCANTIISRRTQRFLYENYGQRPIQLRTYFTLKSWWHVLRSGTVGAAVYPIARTMCGRSLLLKYPNFFSWGLVSREGPSEKGMENTYVSITFHAKGWSKKLADPLDKRKDAPNKEMVTRITGINPEYGLSNVAVLLAALTILRESEKIPDEGGVLTPGAAFGRTSLVDELMKHGIKFEVVSVILDNSFVL